MSEQSDVTQGEDVDATTSVAVVSKAKQQEQKGVGSVTDFVAEVEGTGDKASASDIVKLLSSRAQKNAAVEITVDDKDVCVLVNECDITKNAAETLLRAHGGVLKDALIAFLRQ